MKYIKTQWHVAKALDRLTVRDPKPARAKVFYHHIILNYCGDNGSSRHITSSAGELVSYIASEDSPIL